MFTDFRCANNVRHKSNIDVYDAPNSKLSTGLKRVTLRVTLIKLLVYMYIYILCEMAVFTDFHVLSLRVCMVPGHNKYILTSLQSYILYHSYVQAPKTVFSFSGMLQFYAGVLSCLNFRQIIILTRILDYLAIKCTDFT